MKGLVYYNIDLFHGEFIDIKCVYLEKLPLYIGEGGVHTGHDQGVCIVN